MSEEVAQEREGCRVTPLLCVLQALMGQCRSMTSHHGMERKAKWSLSSLTKATSSWREMRWTLLLWSPPTPGTLANPELCCQRQAMPLCTCGTGWTSRPPAESSRFPPGPPSEKRGSCSSGRRTLSDHGSITAVGFRQVSLSLSLFHL